MTVTRMPTQLCPGCGATVSASTGANHDQAPSTGDVTICVSCVQVLVFEAGLKLRLLRAGEIETLPDVAKAMVRTVQEQVRRVPIAIRRPRENGGNA